VRRHARASSGGTIWRRGAKLVDFACGSSDLGASRYHSGTGASPRTLLPLLAVALVAIALAPASASAACPNEVFRAGPGTKLPECRAYELVSPAYTGGLPPTFEGFLGNLPGIFATDTVTPEGDSVVYHTVGGGLSGFSATGYVDRYRAKRTAGGWVTEPISPGGDEMVEGGPGGVSADHEYSVGSAVTPTAKLWPGFVEEGFLDYLRTPNGYEPVGRGSLGDAAAAETYWISPHGEHVIFGSEAKLEPDAGVIDPSRGIHSVETLYDRRPGGPTHVVSLLPGDEPVQARDARFAGATRDGTEVAFTVPNGAVEGEPTLYVRRDNAVTEEVIRSAGLAVGKEVECHGPESGTFEYQWLRNGAEIGGATSSTYTTTTEDEGTVIQCRVTASDSEGTSIATSETRVVEPYLEKSFPETPAYAWINDNSSKSAAVGTALTCSDPGESFDEGVALSYSWLSDGSPIGGATSSTYTPVEADAGHALQCLITGSNANGTALAYSNVSVSIYKAAPKASANPAVSNLTSAGDATPAVGDELSCSEGTWSGSPSFAYQWLRNGAEIGGATSATYTVVAEDEGKALQCRVTATNGGGSTQAVSDRVVAEPQPATAPPKQTSAGSVSGTPQVGASLDCGEGGWEGEPSFTRQWLRNGTEIGGATSYSYELTSADLETVVQCRLTATNAGGAVVAIDANGGAKVVTHAVPRASAGLHLGSDRPGFTFDGIFNGRVFYSGVTKGPTYAGNFADIYMYDLDEKKSTRISKDASIVNVSEDGSHVYFLSYSPIGGEGEAGKPNLGVWTAADGNAKFIATVSEEDAKDVGRNQGAGLNTWAQSLETVNYVDYRGRAMNHTRSTPDGSAFAFESTAQLTGFDNVEQSAEECGNKETPGDRCDEVYRYDAESEELTCVSCGPGSGPATGNARLETLNFDAGLGGVEPATVHDVVESLTTDGEMVFFESTEGLVPQDGNKTKDVYRWRKGAGVALISTGQDLAESAIYGVTPDGSNVIFATRQPLLAGDENGSTVRLYDARVDGGFPPPEEAVTEPCVGDPCQGAASGEPEPPNVASSTLNGGGNVPPRVHCHKGARRVSRNGRERCLARHHRRHRRAHHKRRAAR